MNAYPLSFDNTENAFAYKKDKELKKASFLFGTMNNRLLVKLGTALTPWIMRTGLPVKGLIRNTIFEQFVGGETLEETAPVVHRLSDFNVKTILDYGVEGKEGEENFDRSCEGFVRVVKYASAQRDIPYISIKVTGFARFSLLEKLDSTAGEKSGYNGNVHTEILDEAEKAEWERVVERMDKIVAVAAAGDVAVLVDAEESWIQDPVDALTMMMMKKYNHGKTVVYNTVQLYRTDRLSFLKESIAVAAREGFLLGVKLVRGAYMEKERKRAKEMNYPSPIQPDKATCDRDYDAGLRVCMENIGHVALIVASHNEKSNLYAVELMTANGIGRSDPRIHFSQLYGMSDHITFNLAKAGYSVSKYVPFGPIGDVIPYLMRRAHENTSVAGQTSRELALIRAERERREKEIGDRRYFRESRIDNRE